MTETKNPIIQNMELNDKVWDLLIELFPEKAGKYEKRDGLEGLKYFPQRYDIGFILTEILPVEIWYSWGKDIDEYCFEFTIKRRADGIYINYMWSSISLYNSNQLYHQDIWQALLSLLKAIEGYPSKDKMKCVYGEK